jgi:hypothetical protein
MIFPLFGNVEGYQNKTRKLAQMNKEETSSIFFCRMMSRAGSLHLLQMDMAIGK